MRTASSFANRKSVSLEAATAQYFDLERTRLRNLVLPLRDRLGSTAQTPSQRGNPAKVLNDFIDAMHAHRVNALTPLRKFSYSRLFAGNGKLSYMSQPEKREPVPRALRRGSAIIDARKRLKLSQERVAQELGVSREAVSNWERGVVGEIERRYRLGLCKLLGLEEQELLLDPEGVELEFEMPLSHEAKSIAYRWDDLPETVRVELKGRIAEVERLLRTNPEYARHLFPELDPKRKGSDSV